MKKAAVSSFLIAVILLTVVVIAGAHQPPTQAAPCLYGYEWLHRFRFPLQADPHGSYPYVVVPKLPAAGSPSAFLSMPSLALMGQAAGRRRDRCSRANCDVCYHGQKYLHLLSREYTVSF